MNNKTINIIIAVVAVVIIGFLIWRLPAGGPTSENGTPNATTTEITEEDIGAVTPPTPPPKPSGPMAVKVFFGNTKIDPGTTHCERVYPATRLIPRTQAVARAALEELFKGPTDLEKAQGYLTTINPGVKINKLAIVEGTALVDLSQELGDQVGGACAVSTIRAQITETLKQFPTVNAVTISIDGNSQDILQP